MLSGEQLASSHDCNDIVSYCYSRILTLTNNTTKLSLSHDIVEKSLSLSWGWVTGAGGGPETRPQRAKPREGERRPQRAAAWRSVRVFLAQTSWYDCVSLRGLGGGGGEGSADQHIISMPYSKA